MKTPPDIDPTVPTRTTRSSRPAAGLKLTGGITRRHMLIGLAALIAEAGFWSNPLFSNAQTPATNSTATPGAGPALSPSAAAFLAFSVQITGHADLNPETAGRIEAAMQKNYPDFSSQLPKLAAFLQDHKEPKALLAAATGAGLRDLALAIVAAWYTGTVGSGKSAVVVSYAEALMYQPVADGQTVPTYCNYGPLWWTKAPPAIRVAPPTARAVPTGAPAPATSGTPEQKSKSTSL